MNSETRECQNCKNQFVIEPEDFSFYKKIKVPPPTWCPECRMIRRFIWRNDHFLFRRPDALDGKEIFAGFSPEVKATIYILDYWNSDAWDPLSYGKDYDFSRPFFEQFRELLYTVPWPAKSVQRMVASDYCDQASGFKNSYLCFGGDGVENSAYLVMSSFAKDTFDGYENRSDELCYENVMVDDCFRVFFSVDCENCTDVWFSRDLAGCNNCIGCVGLRNKSYHIFNKPYSREEYAAKLKEFNLGSHAALEAFGKKSQEFWLTFPVKFMHGVNNVRSTGEHMHDTKNVIHSFDVHGGEDMKYCQFVAPPASESYDYSGWGVSTSRMYESMTCGEQCSDMRFCFESWPGSKSMEYSAFCRSSSDLFGCVGLKKKKYCIFNKEYSREEYEKLKAKIIEQMDAMPYTDSKGRVYRYGEYFPMEFTPFAYNETIANDFFPLKKEEAEAKGFLWRNPEPRDFQTTIGSEAIPDRINEVGDDILKEIIKCGECGKAYRIIQMELDFYRRIGLPLPRRCVQCRFKRRFAFVNPPKFWEQDCFCAGAKDATGVHANTGTHVHGAGKCPNKFLTSYAPGRAEIIYCEQCYQAEVI